MALLDYYGILQVAEDAGADVIRAAYRALAARLAGGPPGSQAAAEMALAQEAHMVLSDPAMRAGYDEARRQAIEDVHESREAARQRWLEEHRLPNIRMTPEQAGLIGQILAACPAQVCDVCRTIMERWERARQIVDPTAATIGLKLAAGAPGYSVAGLLPPVGRGNTALIVLGWESLRRGGVFAAADVDRFQAAVRKLASTEVTESSAHIRMDAAFTVNHARELLRALAALARAAQTPGPKPDLVWDQSLPPLNVTVGRISLENMQETLRACVPRVRDRYALLINGWGQAGGTIQCSSPGRIYLKLETASRNLGPNIGYFAHKFTLLALVAPKNHHEARIDVDWNLTEGSAPYLDYIPEAVDHFQATVAKLPGYGQRGVVHSIDLTDAFDEPAAQALLIAALDLKAASDRFKSPLRPPLGGK